MAFLKKNAKATGILRQTDEYFVPKHRNFISRRPIKEWLRLRTENGEFTINYKTWHYNRHGKSLKADEFETQVSDIERLRDIFNALNMKPIVRVDKLRSSWRYRNYEIGIDTVPGLGTFVEIESKGKGGTSKKITKEMVAFLKSIGVGRIERNYQGYPFLLLFPEKAKYHEE